jgi:hypothetical protein
VFEPSLPERFGEEELLDTLGKEYASDDDPNEDRRCWRFSGQGLLNERLHVNLFHQLSSRLVCQNVSLYERFDELDLVLVIIPSVYKPPRRTPAPVT